MRFETKAIHSGLDMMNDSNAIVPPISPSTIFEHGPEGHREGELHYTRAQNPNRAQLEALLASLEEGDACAAFSSGVAATAALFQALKPGDHIILPNDVYHGTRKLVKELFQTWGLRADFVDMTSTEAVENTINDETKLIWIETPSNPLLLITDIEEICTVAEKSNVKVCVDNTWPSPVNQQPLKLGADLVLHSTTKYLGGHSDLLGGAVISRKRDSFFERISEIQTMAGSVPSPRDCWLLSRSIRTLSYRVRGHNENAGELAEYLMEQPKVENVFYPGLKNHKGHEIAGKQMNGYGGMISFLVRGGEKEALGVVGRSQLIKRATSLGGVESTWEHRRSSEGEGSNAPENLIRISVGLEHPDDLIEDLERSFG